MSPIKKRHTDASAAAPRTVNLYMPKTVTRDLILLEATFDISFFIIYTLLCVHTYVFLEQLKR